MGNKSKTLSGIKLNFYFVASIVNEIFNYDK